MLQNHLVYNSKNHLGPPHNLKKIKSKLLTCNETERIKRKTKLVINPNLYYGHFNCNSLKFNKTRNNNYNNTTPYSVNKKSTRSKIHLDNTDNSFSPKTNLSYTKYPFLKGRIKSFKFADGEGWGKSNAYAWTSGIQMVNGSISINIRFSQDFNNFLENIKKDVISKWHPEINEKYLIESVIIHEYGHVMEGIYKFIKGTESLPSKNIRDKIMKEFGGNEYKNIKDKLSEYAATNSKEWFAEAFCEYVTSNNPRPVAKAFGEYFDKKIAPKIKEEFDKNEKILKQKLKELKGE